MNFIHGIDKYASFEVNSQVKYTASYRINQTSTQEGTMTQRKLKIVIIGGGSSYTPEIIEGFINRHSELPVGEICLVDCEEGQEKVNIVGSLAQRMVQKAGNLFKVNITLDRKAALKDADFVCTQFRVGLLKARVRDERTALKYDMIGQETNGVGGFAKAMRTIPVILDICKDMEALCPNAWLVNFTNPSGMVTEAVLKHSNIKKVIGLCNVPVLTEKGIEKHLGLEPNEYQMQVAGLNHFIYIRHLWHAGQDRMKEVLDLIAENPDPLRPKNIPPFKWDPDQVRNLGVVPCCYHRYYYLPDQIMLDEIAEEKAHGTRGEIVAKMEQELFELYKDPDLAIKPPQLAGRGGEFYSDAACDLISAIYNDKRTIMHVNIRNNGTIKELPEECAVEVSCVITSNGPVPLNVERFENPAIVGLLRLMKAFEELTVEAAVTGDYGTMLQALTINPMVRKGEITRKVLDELLEINAEYLPQINR